MQPRMHTSNRYLLIGACATGVLSCFYFLSLLVHVPFIITAFAVLVAVAGICLYLLRRPATDESGVPAAMPWMSLGMIVVALGFICWNINVMALKYGGWDAMAIWNLHAKYLSDPEHWAKLFQNKAYGHPDYPLCLPATTAFFMRLAGADEPLVVAFAVSAAFTLTIPVLIYRELALRSQAVAVGVLVVFIVEHYYIVGSTSQYADVVVAFFLLMAFVCGYYMQYDKRYVFMAAFCIACCAWTKNEGALLLLIFMAWHSTTFFTRQHIFYALAGLALPLGTLAIFKAGCPVQNDLLADAHGSIFGYLLQPERYAAVAMSYKKIIFKELPFTTVALAIFCIVCVVKRSAPGKPFYILLTCVVAYSMIYIVTPKDIYWHLTTSHSRLLLQLMPALVYVMASHIADIPFQLPGVAKTKLP